MNNQTDICNHIYHTIYGQFICEICGKIISNIEYSVWCKKNNLHTPLNRKLKSSIGWICPICGVGNSPTNIICHCMKSKSTLNDNIVST